MDHVREIVSGELLVALHLVADVVLCERCEQGVLELAGVHSVQLRLSI